jgi:hypothetical protein
MKKHLLVTSLVLPCFSLQAQVSLPSNVVINEFQYDDTGTDDREYVELYNPTNDPIDISGWVVGGYDATTNNPSATIPTGTTLAAQSYYVLGNAGVLNLNQTVGANFLENDNEVITLRDSNGTLIDALAYETNKGVGFVASTTATPAPANLSGVVAQVGPAFCYHSARTDRRWPGYQQQRTRLYDAARHPRIHQQSRRRTRQLRPTGSNGPNRRYQHRRHGGLLHSSTCHRHHNGGYQQSQCLRRPPAEWRNKSLCLLGLIWRRQWCH